MDPMAENPVESDTPDLTVLHNPRCSTSRYAVDTLSAAGVGHTVVRYLTDPLDETALRDLIGKLVDPVTDLVRRDSGFERAGLTEAEVADEEGVIRTLLAHPEVMQRPILVTAERAFIGRPKTRVDELIP